MRPYVIPKGTTPRVALLELLPAEHAARVPRSVRASLYRGVVKLRGDGGGTFSIAIDGASLSIREGDDPDRQFWLATDVASVTWALSEAMQAQSQGAGGPAWQPLVEVPTDPRLVARLLAMDGRVVVEVTGVPGVRSRLWVAVGCGSRAVRHVDEQEPDTTIALPYEVTRRMGTGEIDMKAAGEAGQLRIEGSRMLAMQFMLVMSMMGPQAGR